MKPAERVLKNLAVSFVNSPLYTLSEIGRRLLPGRKVSTQVLRLQNVTRETPLVLQIETTNICNACCVFCAYPKMIRDKGVMSMPLFERIVREYAAMGGGPVSLTPVVGDALLDPHLMDRLRILEVCPEVPQISLTTNAIALERYPDKDVCRLLETLDCIQVSIGGLDAVTYMALYGVDRFSQVQRGMERLLALREAVADPAHITFAFRTNDWKFEKHFRRQLDGLRRRGVFVSHIWNYSNYSGSVKSDDTLNLVVMDRSVKIRRTCIYASVHMAVCWDGRITACGCADFEGGALRIGQVGEGSLMQVWSGKRRTGILDSFGKGNPAGICRECSAYQPDSFIFSRKFCRDIGPHRSLPLEYFQLFWGG
jgi:MoaA/NifB/PqqE/SkfB family radical SAM enzyme